MSSLVIMILFVRNRDDGPGPAVDLPEDRYEGSLQEQAELQHTGHLNLYYDQ